ncbi:hypothetical protein XELAEV_18001518mg [Xenopus laevis]|nr:hypothetical protein XELAEV_18001518mg [Xenopus laevis]
MSLTEKEKKTESRIWNNMVETFENLDSRSFTKLKHKLIYKSPAGMKPITWRQVEEAREHELVNIIIRHYTIKHGPQMTVEILEEINERQASEELQAALMTSE